MAPIIRGAVVEVTVPNTPNTPLAVFLILVGNS